MLGERRRRHHDRRAARSGARSSSSAPSRARALAHDHVVTALAEVDADLHGRARSSDLEDSLAHFVETCPTRQCERARHSRTTVRVRGAGDERAARGRRRAADARRAPCARRACRRRRRARRCVSRVINARAGAVVTMPAPVATTASDVGARRAARRIRARESASRRARASRRRRASPTGVASRSSVSSASQPQRSRQRGRERGLAHARQSDQHQPSHVSPVARPRRSRRGVAT